MRMRSVAQLGLALPAILSLALFGQTNKGAAAKKLETAPLKSQVNPANGAALYKAHCASCHGEDGKGGGPVADSLKMKPSDLTTLSRRNAGKFPVYRVEQLLGGSAEMPVHGSKQMPVWGPVFRQLDRDTGVAAMRVRNLVSHLESIQVK